VVSGRQVDRATLEAKASKIRAYFMVNPQVGQCPLWTERLDGIVHKFAGREKIGERRRRCRVERRRGGIAA
jgi:hypothetical protein